MGRKLNTRKGQFQCKTRSGQIRLLADKSTFYKWGSLTSEIMGAQYQCAPIRVKDKDSKAKEPWMSREIKIWTRKGNNRYRVLRKGEDRK